MITSRNRIQALFGVAVLPATALIICAAAAPPRSAKVPARGAKMPAASHNGAGFERDVAPVVQKYCVSCHGALNPSADLPLTGYKTGAQALKARDVWEKVASNVAGKHMPPQGVAQPTQAERDKLVAWVEAAISKADCDLKDPGRVTMRRLNRAEYNNTVRDLLGVSVRPADDFPSDDVGYGFDNIGDVLSISPLLMEKYLAAARNVAQAAIVAPEDRASVTTVRFSASRLTGDGGEYPQTGGRILFASGETGVDFDFPGAGEYDVRVTAFEQHAGPEAARMAFKLGNNQVRTVQVLQQENNPGTYEARILVPAPGKRRVAVAFLNDYYVAESPDPKLRGDRNLVIQSLEVVPQGVTMAAAPEKPTSHRRLVTILPVNNSEVAKNAATRRVMEPFLRHAWRRPVTSEELDRVVRVAALGRKNGGSYEKGLQVALQAALVSPNFLFRVEADPPGAKGKRLLNDFELASRLSYFLWSSMPDDILLAVAAEGKLKDPRVLEAQAKRMLKDPKARALTDNFAAQWLNLRKLSVVTPDPSRFARFDEPLRASMRTETEMFFNGIVAEDRSILEFLDADYTYLNEPLARHYGNTEVKGAEFQRVKLRSGRRGGVLTQASILTLTSNPTRTSPVKRGKWVAENILGTPPPAPPPGVGELPEKKGPLTGTTVRQLLEEHRKNPSCASCHRRLDPIGFGLENFDAIGAWRDKDGETAIDNSGDMPDGARFAGPIGLKNYLKGRKNQFARAFTERLLTYALGRGIESSDRCNLDAMAARVASRGYRFSEVVTTIITSEPFRMRQPDTAAKPARPKIAAR